MIMSQKKKSEILQCCICQNNNHIKKFKKIDNYEYVKCETCNMVFLSVDCLHSDSFYQDSKTSISSPKSLNNKHAIEYWSIPHLYEKHKSVFQYYFQERLSLMQKCGYKKGSLLDVGCGYGFFVDFCKKCQIQANGIDVEKEQVAWGINNLNLDLKAISIENYMPDSTFEAIIMADVLEHLWNPVEVLSKMKNILSEYGLLIIQVPNLLGFKLPPGNSWGPPHHLWQFSINTLDRLLSKTGFQILLIQTGVLGIIGMYERGGPTLLEKIYIYSGKKLNIGNRLLMICKKV